MAKIIFVTGTDTGVGKTVLAALLVRFLRERGRKVAGLKPICSGGRGDARRLYEAMDRVMSLDEINPWHFRAPIAPVLAARRERQAVTPAEVVRFVRAAEKPFATVLVEGAGGLLSPLGEGFDSRDLIRRLGAETVVVAPDKLGVVNQVRLTLEALPGELRRKARLVLMSPAKPDAATAGNAALLAEFFDPRRTFRLPWLGKKFEAGTALRDARVRKTLRGLTGD